MCVIWLDRTSGLEIHFWTGKAILILQSAIPLKHLRLLNGHQDQGQDHRQLRPWPMLTMCNSRSANNFLSNFKPSVLGVMAMSCTKSIKNPFYIDWWILTHTFTLLLYWYAWHDAKSVLFRGIVSNPLNSSKTMNQVSSSNTTHWAPFH